MIYVIVIVAIIYVVVDSIREEGNFLSKLALAALVASIAFLILKWILGWDFILTMAKASAATTILATLFNIIAKIVG